MLDSLQSREKNAGIAPIQLLMFDGHQNSVQSSIFGRSHLRILLKPWQMMYFHPKK